MAASRVADHFEREPVWRALSFVLPAQSHLNLGYSPGKHSHLLGSPQARLVALVADTLACAPPGRVLDVGCGRGGPAAIVRARTGRPVVGVDLVATNLEQARENAPDASFLRGDARHLPIGDESVAAATALDTLVYVPETVRALVELKRVLVPGGTAVVTDLLVGRSIDPSDPRLESFAESFALARLETADTIREAIDVAGLTIRAERDLTRASVGGFRRYTRAFLAVTRSPLSRLLVPVADRVGLELGPLREQVRIAHRALPALRHRMFVLSA